jgi:hypothetical protein
MLSAEWKDNHSALGNTVGADAMDKKKVYPLIGGGVVALVAVIVALSAYAAGGNTTVSGHVTFQGRPVIWGSVMLVGPDGHSAVGRIQPDGSFTVPNAPTGEVGVSVTSPDPLAQHYATQLKTSRDRIPVAQWAAPPVDRQQWFVLPKHYENATTSNLTLTVKRGNNPECDLSLVP